MLWAALSILLCVPLTGSQSVDEDARQDWVDPSDMLNFETTTRTMKNQKVVIEPIQSSVSSEETDRDSRDTPQTQARPDSCGDVDQCTCEDLDKCSTDLKQAKRGLKSCQKQLDSVPPSQTAYLKQFIRVLMEKLPQAHSQLHQQGSVAYSATLLLAHSDLDLFSDLIYTDGGSLQDSHRSLVNMIQEVKLIGDYRPETWYSWAGDWVLLHLTTVLQMMAVFALATVGVLATAHIQVSWFSFFGKLLLLLFLISIPWNWWHLYKIELAQRQAKALQEMPAECRPEDQGVWTLLKSAFSVSVDKCAKYHEQMMVDPIWEVAPTRAIAVTLTKFCVEPLEHIGRSLGKFIRAPLEDLPVQMWPIVLIFLVVVFTLSLIMGFGYKIRLFYLFGIEPAERRKIDGVEELQKGIQGQHDMIQALTHKVESLTREAHKPLDTEMLLERQLQALTGAPHWEGRGDHYPPRYIESAGYSRGPDSRYGLTGEGYAPMPVPQYPRSQPPVDVYPPASTHSTLPQPTIIPAQPPPILHTPYPPETPRPQEMPCPQEVQYPKEGKVRTADAQNNVTTVKPQEPVLPYPRETDDRKTQGHTETDADSKTLKSKESVMKGDNMGTVETRGYVSVETVTAAEYNSDKSEMKKLEEELDSLENEARSGEGVKDVSDIDINYNQGMLVTNTKLSKELLNGEDAQSVHNRESKPKFKDTGKTVDHVEKVKDIGNFKDKEDDNAELLNDGQRNDEIIINGGLEPKQKVSGLEVTEKFKDTAVKDIDLLDDKDKEVTEEVQHGREGRSLRPEVEDIGTEC